MVLQNANFHEAVENARDELKQFGIQVCIYPEEKLSSLVLKIALSSFVARLTSLEYFNTNYSGSLKFNNKIRRAIVQPYQKRKATGNKTALLKETARSRYDTTNK